MNVLDNFWLKFMTLSQLYAIAQLKVHATSLNNSKYEEIEQKLINVRKTINEIPSYGDISELDAKDVKIALHYQLADCDWYIATLNNEDTSRISVCFARLNNDYWNAELGSVTINELLQYNAILDLNWNTETTLREVMDENNEKRNSH